mmetsp:Transcript_36705/g.93537  ORF Transcript_36705/g.93537 Transcript_36705/m.93537 type:complete len:211 (-) Transcript_36705:73-705(-)
MTETHQQKLLNTARAVHINRRRAAARSAVTWLRLGRMLRRRLRLRHPRRQRRRGRPATGAQLHRRLRRCRRQQQRGARPRREKRRRTACSLLWLLLEEVEREKKEGMEQAATRTSVASLLEAGALSTRRLHPRRCGCQVVVPQLGAWRCWIWPMRIRRPPSDFGQTSHSQVAQVRSTCSPFGLLLSILEGPCIGHPVVQLSGHRCVGNPC